MMHRKRGWAVAAVLLVVLQLLLQTRAAHIVQQNPTVTVTLSSPLTAGQLAAAREWEKSRYCQLLERESSSGLGRF